MNNETQNNHQLKFRVEYMNYLMRNGKEPITVFAFCEEIGVQEQEFYKYFGSFKALEKEIWKELFLKVNQILENDDNFPSYSSYEKWLSFLYTAIETFKSNRSYIVLKCENLDRKDIRPWFMESFRKEIFEWSNAILNEGLESEEIATRPLITAKYNEVLWVQFLYVLRVWINDESEDFQITDAAIEKTSVLLFELMKRGPIDMLIDFVKFAYQNKAY